MNLIRRTFREGGAIAGRGPAVDAPARPDTVESGPHRPVNSQPPSAALPARHSLR